MRRPGSISQTLKIVLELVVELDAGHLALESRVNYWLFGK
jgi:hypothetical protein